MAINLDYPRKFTDLGQVYSHLARLTDALNSQLNAITADSLAPDVAASLGLIQPLQQQTQAEETAIKTKLVSLKRTVEIIRGQMPAPKNLLDNADFLHPINQRGQISYKVKGYTIDRWRTMTDAGTVTVLETGISLPTGVALRQYVHGDTEGMLTVAVCDSAGQVYCKAGTLSGGTIATDKAELARDDNGNAYFLLYGGNTFRWAALYRGEYTAETLPAFTPRDHAAELLECQRYYIRLKTFHQAGQMLTTGGRFGFTLPTEMRIKPTLTVVASGTMICNRTQNVAVTGVTLNAISGNRVQIYTTHASQSGWSLQVGIWLNGEIELSADL